MAKVVHTVEELKETKPKEKAFKVYDGGASLYLKVMPNGKKYWQYDWKIGQSRGTLSYGIFEAVKEKVTGVRERHAINHDLVQHGIRPDGISAAKKKSVWSDKEVTFRSVAEKWMEEEGEDWSPGHIYTIVNRLKKHINPVFGDTPIKAIDSRKIKEVIKAPKMKKLRVTAKRTRDIINAVLNYAVDEEIITTNPCPRPEKKKGKKARVKVVHIPAVTDEKEFGQLMRDIYEHKGNEIATAAVKLLALTLVRPSEVRQASWPEFNLDNKIWSIPKERMKKGEEHKVPLSKQALEILAELKGHTGSSPLLFPSALAKGKPVSASYLNVTLKRIGEKDRWKGRHSCHSFRAAGSTMLYGMKRKVKVDIEGVARELIVPLFEGRWIEAVLAHADKNAVRAAYQRGSFLEERTHMMQFWADHLDMLRQGAKVLPFKAASE